MRVTKIAVVYTACALLAATYARAEDDCRQWIGVWDIAYDNGTASVWTIDRYDNDPGSEVVLCNAQGAEQVSGGAERPIYIMYILFANSYYFAYSAEKPAHDFPSYNLLLEEETLSSEQKGLTGTRRPGTGPDDKLCPAESMLGADSREAGALRLLRDRVLASHPAGRGLITLYYAHGRRLANIIDSHPALRSTAEAVLRQLASAADTLLQP
jgi:hypothetical protein